MSKYQLIVLSMIVSSLLTALFGSIMGSNKMFMALTRLFALITLAAILLIGYRAFFLIR